jgi:outer-membrane receptor for ferric coprogen and ferric-rhodotorulic acid
LSSNTPRNLLKAWTSLQLPGVWRRWTVGGTLQAQNENSQLDGSYTCTMLNAFGLCVAEQLQFVRPEQKAYATISPRIGYEIDRHWRAALTINNALDRRYYQTVGSIYGDNWYGDPRNFLLRLDGRF